MVKSGGVMYVWKGEKFVVAVGIRNTDSPARNLFTIFTTPFRIPQYSFK